jgi:hypothetical protein
MLLFGIDHPKKNEFGTNEKLRLVYNQDFNSNVGLEDFVFAKKSQWKLCDDGAGGKALEAVTPNDYNPKVRSPKTICVLSKYVVGDFILEADLLQKPVDHSCLGEDCIICRHRDMCVFWAFQDPSHFYYAHIGYIPDVVAHNIFMVNNQPRAAVTSNRNDGVDWGNNTWKHIKVERMNGTVKVYFEDMRNPVLEATDTTFVKGRIGFGSFDESGKIDNIRLWAKKPSLQNARFFESY